MRAEVIAIGDELTSGQRLDTNSQWLSQRLGDLGISTIRHTTIGDDLQSNIEAFQQAASRADIVVCTGGLGPTLDDLTRQALAEAFGLELVLDVDSLTHIENLFKLRGREMPERNRIQAMFPTGSSVVANPHGSAPGIDLTVSQAGRKSRFFALPGVPAEMFQMWDESVQGGLEVFLGSQQGALRYHSIKVFGIGESDVEVKLPELIARDRIPTVGITVSRATINLRIMGRAHSEERFRELIGPTVSEIERELGDLIFGEGDVELENVVLQMLEAQSSSLACVEVGAASWVTDWMLQVACDTSLRPFKGGLAFPDLNQATDWLEESLHAAEHDGKVLMERLAQQARIRFQSDWGLALGVYPTRRELECPGAIFEFVFALCGPKKSHVEQRAMGGHPDVLGPRVGKTALDVLRRQLRSAK